MTENSGSKIIVPLSAALALAMSAQLPNLADVSDAERLGAIRDAVTNGTLQLLDADGKRVQPSERLQVAGTDFDRGQDQTPFDKK